jgi:hypothetical protein
MSDLNIFGCPAARCPYPIDQHDSIGSRTEECVSSRCPDGVTKLISEKPYREALLGLSCLSQLASTAFLFGFAASYAASERAARGPA